MIAERKLVCCFTKSQINDSDCLVLLGFFYVFDIQFNTDNGVVIKTYYSIQIMICQGSIMAATGNLLNQSGLSIFFSIYFNVLSLRNTIYNDNTKD